MEVIHDLLQVLLGLVLAGHVGEFDALRGLDIHLGVGFAEGHGVGTAHLLHHLAGHELAQGDKDDEGQDPPQQADQQGGLLDLHAGGGDSGLQQPLCQVRIRDHGGLINGISILVGEQNAVVLLLDLRLSHLGALHHAHKGVVVHLADLALGHPGHGQEVEQHHHQQNDGVVVKQGFFGRFDFVHGSSSFALPQGRTARLRDDSVIDGFVSTVNRGVLIFTKSIRIPTPSPEKYPVRIRTGGRLSSQGIKSAGAKRPLLRRGGDGEIRTLARCYTPTAFRVRTLQPLGYISVYPNSLQ